MTKEQYSPVILSSFFTQIFAPSEIYVDFIETRQKSGQLIFQCCKKVKATQGLSRMEIWKLLPAAKSGPPPTFINKALLEHSHTETVFMLPWVAAREIMWLAKPKIFTIDPSILRWGSLSQRTSSGQDFLFAETSVAALAFAAWRPAQLSSLIHGVTVYGFLPSLSTRQSVYCTEQWSVPLSLKFKKLLVRSKLKESRALWLFCVVMPHILPSCPRTQHPHHLPSNLDENSLQLLKWYKIDGSPLFAHGSFLPLTLSLWTEGVHSHSEREGMGKEKKR